MLDESLKERMEAYRVLLQWQKDGSFIKEAGLSPFAMELALGVCRRHLFLQYFVKTLVKKMPSLEVCTVLEMGLFQMFFTEVPDHAAVATTVELIKAASLGEGSARFMNAVLHAARKSGLPALPPQKVRRVSIENSSKGAARVYREFGARMAGAQVVRYLWRYTRRSARESDA